MKKKKRTKKTKKATVTKIPRGGVQVIVQQHSSHNGTESGNDADKALKRMTQGSPTGL